MRYKESIKYLASSVFTDICRYGITKTPFFNKKEEREGDYMYGGASGVLLGSLNLPVHVAIKLKNHGLVTAQDVIDEGKQSLQSIGIQGTSFRGLNEAVHQETGMRIE